MPPPASYAISSRLPESFLENSIQDIPENDVEKVEREEREQLVKLEADFIGLIYNSRDDKILPTYAPHMMMQRQLSQIIAWSIEKVIDDNGAVESKEEGELKEKKEVWDLLG